MKRQIIFCAVMVIMMVSEALAGPGFRDRPHELQDRLTTLRNWRLMEEFDLSGDRAQQTFKILKRFDDERVRLIRKRRSLLKKLRQEVEATSTSEARLRDLVQELTETNVELARLPGKELEGLQEVFSARERAKYLLFSERIAREMRGLIPKRRPEGEGW